MKASIINFPIDQGKKLIEDNYENIKNSYRYLSRADRPSNLSCQEKQILDFCLQVTAKEGWATTDYESLQDKIGKSRDTVKRVLKANSDIISWKFERCIRINGKKYYNIVFLERTSDTQNLLNEAMQKHLEHQAKMCTLQRKIAWSSTQKCAPHYIDKIDNIENKDKSRSSESEFLNFDSSVSKANKKEANIKQTKSSKKTISEFLPLNEDDRNYINKLAERDFSLCYMNKLFEKLASSKPNHSFYTKNIFMKYAAEVIAREKRDEKIVNKGVFNINQNSGQYKIESYLTEVENSIDRSSTGLIRRKIAAQFPTEIAYQILKNCYFHTDIINGVYTLRPLKKLNLTPTDKDKLSSIIFSSLYKESLSKVKKRFEQSFSAQGSTERIVEKLNIIEPEQDNSTSKLKNVAPPVLNLGEEGTLWNKISTKLLERFGEQLHKSWFSRLKAQEDQEKKTLKLIAPSNFISDYIKSDYNWYIQEYLNTERTNYEIFYETN